MAKTPEEIVLLVRDAGVIGAAGAGFPTHVKLQAKVKTVIVNGSECEPLLYTDKSILKNRAEDVIEGLKLAMHAMGAEEGVIAVNEFFMEVVSAIQKAIPPQSKNIRVHLLENYYPAGDEFLMVYDITKKIVPEGGRPTDVGVAVLNVLTITQIHQAVNGMPVTEREITIAGEVKEPKVVTVPLGTSYAKLVALAGGPKLKNYSVLDGGPMMGQVVLNLEDGIGKTTTGVLVLPVKHSTNSLCECQRSTDICPRSLLGHAIDPDLTLRATHYGMSEPTSPITAAFLCSGCGLCEVAGCDAGDSSPKKVYGKYKKLLTQAGVKNPHHRKEISVHSQYENRKVSVPTLLKKLGMEKYSKHLLSVGRKEVSLVKIPTQKHVGTRSIPTVKLGQSVKRGDLIAMSPLDQLGTVYHASIHGNISEIGENFIEITGHLS